MNRKFAAAFGAILVAAAMAVPALAAPSAVQTNYVKTSNTPTNPLVTSNITATTGNTLVVLWNNYDGGGLSSSVADTPNGSYAAEIGPTDSSNTISTGVWDAVNSVGLSSQPISCSSNGGGNWYQTCGYIELGGVTATPVDAKGGITTTTSTTSPSVSTSGATTQASGIAVGYFAGGSPGTVTEAAGWTTLFDSCNFAGYVCVHAAYKVYAATGVVTYNPGTQNADVYAMGVITYKASGGSTPSVIQHMMTLGVGNLASASAPSCAWADDNGCANAAQTGFMNASYFSSQSFSHPTFNVPGVDYHVGAPTTAEPARGICAASADPAAATTGSGCGQLTSGCSYSVITLGGNLTHGQIYCTGATNPIIHGFEMRAAFGHVATTVYIDSNNIGTVTIRDNHFLADPGVFGWNGFLAVADSGTANLDLERNTIDSAWQSTYSTIAQGTASQSGSTDLNVTACTVCAFAAGQTVSGETIFQQTSGTAGGVGHYLVSQNQTFSGQSVTSVFQTGTVLSLLTFGTITEKYNVFLDNNGRLQTGVYGHSPSGPTYIAGAELFEYNYMSGMLFYENGIHTEYFEGILADGTYPAQFPSVHYVGNLCDQPSTVANSATTACFFYSTGGVAGIMAGFQVEYQDNLVDHNVFSALNGLQNVSFVGLGGSLYDNFVATNNWFNKGVASYYMSCLDSNKIGGDYQVAFFSGTDDGAGTLNVTFAGGIPIAVGQMVWESHGTITGQISGTPGGTGVYSVTGDTSASGGMRSAAASILTAPIISGNHDLNSGSNIDSVAFTIGDSGGLAPCMYPGF